MRGGLNYHFISPLRGGVEEITFWENSLNHDQLEQCVVDVIKGIQVENISKRRFRVTYPFVFSTSAAKSKMKGVKIKGKLTAQNIFWERERKLEHCYQSALKRHKAAEGWVNLSIKINGKGGVEEIKFKNNRLSDQALEHCIEQEVKNIRFPGGDFISQMVSYQLRFSSK